jgi:hypothetical protein
VSWWLSPSGWPQWTPGGFLDDQLPARGYLPIDESQVQAAIDAHNTGHPAPTPPDFVNTTELEDDVDALLADPASKPSLRLKAAYGSRPALPWPGGLVAFWDFTEPAPPYLSKLGTQPFPLDNGAGANVHSATTGPFGGGAVFNGSSDYLTLAAASVGALNVASYGDAVTVCAWVARTDTDTGFIGGLWDEGNAARNYGLFLDLPSYGGDDNVCGHVSATGGVTPGYPASRDYAASARRIPGTGGWRFVAFTYDGSQAIAYLDGLADPRPSFTDSNSSTYAKNPYGFDAGLNRTTAAPFTVGGNNISSGMGNFLTGTIGGLAVFDRALSASEIMQLHLAAKPAAWPIVAFPFYTPTAGAQTLDAFGWKSYRGATATDTTTNLVANNFLVNQASGNDFLFRSGTGDATNTSTAGFCFYGSLSGLRASQVKQITFRLNNSLAADVVRLCVCIGGTWYATNTTYAVPTDGRVGADWSTAVACSFTMSLASGTWLPLTFAAGSALSLAGAPNASALPNGALTGVGFYSPSAAGVVRIDDVTLVG